METSLANNGLCSALSLPLVRQFFIEIWTATISPPPLTDADIAGLWCQRPSPPKYPLTPRIFMETSLASDGLCSALSLPLVRQFIIEIWTTIVAHAPAQIPQTQIWTGSDVIPPLPNTPRHPETWWKKLSWWWAFQFTIGCNIMRVYHSNTRGYANDVVPIYRKFLHFYKI